MKKGFKSLCVLSLFMMLVAACESVYDDRLRTKWQLREREREGVVIPDDSTFYNFQKTVFYFQVLKRAGSASGHASFMQKGDSLIIDIVDDAVAFEDNLRLLQWDNRRMGFVIRELTLQRMVLEDRGTVYRFRRY